MSNANKHTFSFLSRALISSSLQRGRLTWTHSYVMFSAGCHSGIEDTVVAHYLQKISDDFNFGQKKCPKIKPSEIFTVQYFYRTVYL